jgi:hypothetical protein
MEVRQMPLRTERVEHLPVGLCVLQRLRVLAKAADSISMGDVVNGSVRRYGNWGLMPFGAMMGSVVPSTYMRGKREIFNEYEQVTLQTSH